ncbi:type IV pilus assembly protein PilM [Candidatus Falkowbacteria bacterium]|nr:type IV pilus assembly protein PilM [Candidatus Falkowbacteria bacterium]
MFCLFSSQSIGIDITDYSLRLVMLSKKGKSIILEGYSEVFLAPEIVVNGEIKDSQKFSEAISKLIKNIKGNKKIKGEIIASPPEKQTFTVLVDNNEKIQNLDKKTEEIPEIILNNVKNYIPISIDNIYLDWQTVDKNKILITASPKTIIDNYTTAFGKSNLPLTVIDIKTAAILRSIVVNKPKNKNSKLVIHIGESYSSIILGNNDVIEFTMNISLTNQMINNITSKKSNLSLPRTKKIKNNKIDTTKQILNEYLNELVKNIKKVILFYAENNTNHGLIDNITICGAGAMLKDIDKLLKDRLKMEVKIGDPLINIDKNLLKIKNSISFTTAIGMALRGL